MRPWALAAALVLLAGCFTPASHVAPAAQSPSPSTERLAPAAGHTGAALLGCDPTSPQTGSECAQWLGEGAEINLEPSLATHPQDPRQVIVAWTVREKGTLGSMAHVRAGMTTDGGLTWRVTTMRDPAVQDVPGTQRYSFDVRVAFAPDGTALVLYGGDLTRAAQLPEAMARVTLASSKDGGASWTYAHVAERPGAAFDFFALAVAPDTGHIYVATDEIFSGNVWLWRSVDAGASWTGPLLPFGASQIPHSNFHPALAAGPNHTLLLGALHVNGALDRWTETAAMSGDDGSTFDAPREIADADHMILTAPQVVYEQNATGAKLHAIGASPGHLLDVTSSDGGKAWETTRLGPIEGGVPYWGVLAVGTQGSVAGLVNVNDDEHSRWRVTLEEVEPSGNSSRLTLGEADHFPFKGTRGDHASDDYGGLAFAADGSRWVAFSDPRAGAVPRIAVLHLAAP